MLGDGGVLGPGDELSPQRLVGGVQAEGERDGQLQFGGELLDRRGRPTVEMVILRAPMLMPCGEGVLSVRTRGRRWRSC